MVIDKIKLMQILSNSVNKYKPNELSNKLLNDFINLYYSVDEHVRCYINDVKFDISFLLQNLTWDTFTIFCKGLVRLAFTTNKGDRTVKDSVVLLVFGLYVYFCYFHNRSFNFNDFLNCLPEKVFTENTTVSFVAFSDMHKLARDILNLNMNFDLDEHIVDFYIKVIGKTKSISLKTLFRYHSKALVHMLTLFKNLKIFDITYNHSLNYYKDLRTIYTNMMFQLINSYKKDLTFNVEIYGVSEIVKPVTFKIIKSLLSKKQDEFLIEFPFLISILYYQALTDKQAQAWDILNKVFNDDEIINYLKKCKHDKCRDVFEVINKYNYQFVGLGAQYFSKLTPTLKNNFHQLVDMFMLSKSVQVYKDVFSDYLFNLNPALLFCNIDPLYINEDHMVLNSQKTKILIVSTIFYYFYNYYQLTPSSFKQELLLKIFNKFNTEKTIEDFCINIVNNLNSLIFASTYYDDTTTIHFADVIKHMLQKTIEDVVNDKPITPEFIVLLTTLVNAIQESNDTIRILNFLLLVLLPETTLAKLNLNHNFYKIIANAIIHQQHFVPITVTKPILLNILNMPYKTLMANLKKLSTIDKSLPYVIPILLTINFALISKTPAHILHTEVCGIFANINTTVPFQVVNYLLRKLLVSEVSLEDEIRSTYYKDVCNKEKMVGNAMDAILNVYISFIKILVYTKLSSTDTLDKKILAGITKLRTKYKLLDVLLRELLKLPAYKKALLN